MKITLRQLRYIISENIRLALVVPRVRRQNDRRGFSSGVYEESEEEGEKELLEDE